MDTLLGIDLGTSSVKVIVLDMQGRTLGIEKQSYAVKSPHPGWAEGDPQEWWSAVVVAVQTISARLEHITIRAVGLSGQMHGLVLIDQRGRPVRDALLWADERAREEVALYKALPADMQQRLANPLVAGMAGPMLCWLKRHERANYKAGRWMVQPKDWIHFCLTGEIASDASDASATLLYDLPADSWAFDVVDALHLRHELLPEILSSSSVAGALTEQAAQALHIPVGTPVAVGASDTAAAALGTGLLAPGPIQLTVGTGAQIVQLRSAPSADTTLRTHLYRAANDNTWYSMAAVQNAGLVLDWVCRMLGASWNDMYTTATTVTPGSQGLLFRPYLTQERFLSASDGGAFLNLRMYHRREHLLHAALEGVAFNLRRALEILPDIGETKVLRLAGGGTMNAAWRQMLADILRCELVAVDTPDASARGAALLAGIAIGVWPDTLATETVALATHRVAKPHHENVSLYNILYTQYLEKMQ